MDNAFERARAAYGTGAYDDATLEFLFPQLKESEDERIIRAIIDALYSHSNSINLLSSRGYQMGDIEAWLEKQKEQPQEELVYRLNGFMQEYIKEGKDEAEKEHRFKCYQLFWDALEDADFFEQKEQKPTPDWMPKFLDELRSKKNYFDLDEHRDIEGHILAIINWIAPNYFKEKEQKPVEGDNETEIQKAFREGKSAGRKQVLQEIYEGKVKPVDKITAEWLDDELKDKEDK